MDLHRLISVKKTPEKDVYIARVDITDSDGRRYETDYASRKNDGFGLAPKVRDAISAWISSGKTVSPYVPPTPEEVRASLPSITARQLRLGLVSNGIQLADVAAALSSIEDQTQRSVAEIEWEYATQFERAHPLIQHVGNYIGLSPEQIDVMWQQALEL